MSDAISGKTQKQQLQLARQAQAEQAARIAKQEADVAAVEAGQRRLRQGGGGGLLSFLDDILPGTQAGTRASAALRQTFGG